MSDKKPFWSSVPGVVTGVAGVVSAIVGLLGVSLQLGWIGGDDGSPSAATSTSVAGAAGAAGGSTSTPPPTLRGATTVPSSTAASGKFEVNPASISFEPLQPSRESIVTVVNTGDVSLTVRAPRLSGSGADHFRATDVDCTKSPLVAGLSCQVKVTFAPQRPGQYEARLVVETSNALRATEVALKGNAPLG